MKISVDNNELFTLSEIQKQVMKDNILSEEFEDDIKRRLQWVIMHKYQECFKDLKAKWDSKLADNGVQMIPTDPDEYAALVFQQSDYKNRSQRDAESGLL